MDEIEVIRAALLQTSSAGGVHVAWIEAPVSRNRVTTAQALRAYHEVLETLALKTVTTIISAFQLAALPERALLACVQGSSALISAKMIVPRYPSWLAPQTKADLTPVAGVSMHLMQPCTADTLFAPMFQAEKLAVLGQLAAGVAHELGNPLSIISSSLQYLHQRLADANDPASDFAMTALQNVDRMHGLLRSMLDFATTKKPCLEQVDLKEAASEVLHFMSAECIRHKIIVDVAFDPALPKAWVDPCGFKQIILNLIKNALDALVLKGTTLRLRTCMGSNRRAVVEVENNGPPIPADVMTNMFRPFYTTKDGGTGLGLYLSRQIARDHGGDLEVENLQGAVRFTLTLPLDRRVDEKGEECRTS
ncbi:MAG: ATP-binding protein [Deltaproteobacteria bacterium]|nr:ATP-binding protein [Deltaproteobacteria bacterium]